MLPTKQAFVAFVNRQDPEKEIDHFDWTTCAVGEFWYDFTRAERNPSDWVSIVEWAQEELGQKWFVRIGLGGAGLPTYGDLAAWLKANPKSK